MNYSSETKKFKMNQKLSTNKFNSRYISFIIIYKLSQRVYLNVFNRVIQI